MIINATQHAPTAEQSAAGVGAPDDGIREMLTFDEISDTREIVVRAATIAEMVSDHLAVEYGQRVMIGGAPFLMAQLEYELRKRGFTPVYAFSTRVSVEEAQPDGSVRKVNVFKHLGFIEA